MRRQSMKQKAQRWCECDDCDCDDDDALKRKHRAFGFGLASRTHSPPCRLVELRDLQCGKRQPPRRRLERPKRRPYASACNTTTPFQELAAVFAVVYAADAVLPRAPLLTCSPLQHHYDYYVCRMPKEEEPLPWHHHHWKPNGAATTQRQSPLSLWRKRHRRRRLADSSFCSSRPRCAVR